MIAFGTTCINTSLIGNAFEAPSCHLRCYGMYNCMGRRPLIVQMSACTLSSRVAVGGTHVPGRMVQAARRTRQCTALRICALRNIDEPEALLFDCDGVLVDTEAAGHRVSFNEAFKRKGLTHEWDIPLYGELLEIGGGKERMTKYFLDHEDEEPFKSIKDPGERKQFVADLHKLKTDIFMEMIESGAMPLRPGVKRLVGEALAAKVPVAVCSTSNERAVSTIVRVLLGDDVAAKMKIFAGDIVPKKKPDPAIYLLAAKDLDVNPARCVVVEDSRIGLLAARAAGMRCVVTTSSYTEKEDFSTADALFDCIGEPGDERFSLDDLTTPGLLTLKSKQLSVNA